MVANGAKNNRISPFTQRAMKSRCVCSPALFSRQTFKIAAQRPDTTDTSPTFGNCALANARKMGQWNRLVKD